MTESEIKLSTSIHVIARSNLGIVHAVNIKAPLLVWHSLGDCSLSLYTNALGAVDFVMLSFQVLAELSIHRGLAVSLHHL